MIRRAAAGLLAAVLLAGCGSSTLSSSQLRSQASQVCSLASRQTGRIPTPSAPAGSEAFLQRGITVMSSELARLRALRPSKDEADVYSASVQAFTTKLSDLKAAVRELRHGADPMATMKALQRKLGPLESQEDGGWSALEVSACLNR